ncbi:MAG TPA: DUF1294 domain-containing protein [Pseudobacteroides sp.]|uniref:DUF1294 domain-containing protein n=1 Tax=Pseudobacteroides sp. TaxID=1968840 RepID=UPI002F92FFC8
MPKNYIIAVVLIILNIIAFIISGIDKYKARHKKQRISEKTLFLLGIIGGCPGLYSSFFVFRHKTRHMKFMIGIPIIFAIQVTAVLLIKGKIY